MTERPDHTTRLLNADRYLAGGLSADEAAAFEESLSDTKTVAALADAVLLRDALRADAPAASVRTGCGHMNSWRRMLRLAAGPVALGLLVAAGWALTRPSDEGVAVANVGPRKAAPVEPPADNFFPPAAVWAETDWNAANWNDSRPADWESELEESVVDVPTWMLAAIELPDEAVLSDERSADEGLTDEGLTDDATGLKALETL